MIFVIARSVTIANLKKRQSVLDGSADMAIKGSALPVVGIVSLPDAEVHSFDDRTFGGLADVRLGTPQTTGSIG